jgi:hypothetical protein
MRPMSDLRDMFGARVLDVLKRLRFRKVSRIDRDGATWVDFSNGKIAVQLANSPHDADGTRMFLMGLDRMWAHESFELIAAYIRGAADPVGEPLDVQATFLQENYRRIEHLFTPRGSADRADYEEYARQWHLRKFGLDIKKTPWLIN